MKFLKFWFPVLAYCCIIFAVSSIPNIKVETAELPNLDKLVHGIEYGILALLMVRAVRSASPHASALLLFAITIYFVVFYGITDEFHQSFVAGRSSDLTDLMADTVGGALATVIYLYRNPKNVLKG